MDVPEHEARQSLPPRCATCGEIIGVYEPMICVIDGVPRHTARARDPGAFSRADECYHATCCDLTNADSG